MGAGGAPSPQSQSHLLERNAAQEAEWRCQRIDDLEMIEARALDQANRDTAALDQGGKVARLALELVALVLAGSDHDGAGNIVGMLGRAEPVDHAGVELHIGAAGAAPNRLQLLGSADAQCALHDP